MGHTSDFTYCTLYILGLLYSSNRNLKDKKSKNVKYSSCSLKIKFIHPEILLGAFVRNLKFLHINWSHSAVVLFYFLINTCIIMIAIKLQSYSSLGFVACFTLYHMILLAQSWIRSELDICIMQVS